MNNRNNNKVSTGRNKVAKRAKKINISAKALEDFIWMSYRYCIGRRTGAAAMHTDNIAKLIGDNPDIFSKERLEFNAVDIRRQINQVCTYGDSIEVNTCRDIDVFSTVLYKSAEVDNPHEWIYEVSGNGEVNTFKPNKPIEFPFDGDYTDLVVWVKLANWLDKSTHKMITIEYEGNAIASECYPYPQKIDGKYRKVWARISDHCISCNRWTPEECITKIEDIND